MSTSSRSIASADPIRAAADEAAAFRPILDLLGRTEGTDTGRGYNETVGYGAYTGSDVDLVDMTLAQVGTLQRRMLADPDNKPKSSAVGRYQIISPTLCQLARELALDPKTTKFSPDIQDYLAIELLRQCGGKLFLCGELSAVAFQTNISKEWASIPDPETGRSHYGQHAGATVAETQAVLAEARAIGEGNPDPGAVLAEPPAATPAPVALAA